MSMLLSIANHLVFPCVKTCATSSNPDSGSTAPPSKKLLSLVRRQPIEQKRNYFSILKWLILAQISYTCSSTWLLSLPEEFLKPAENNKNYANTRNVLKNSSAYIASPIANAQRFDEFDCIAGLDFLQELQRNNLDSQIFCHLHFVIHFLHFFLVGNDCCHLFMDRWLQFTAQSLNLTFNILFWEIQSTN